MFGRRALKAAIFVDFDNVVPAVGKTALAEQAPAWLAWIERGGFDPHGRRRTFVMKKIYWNSSGDVHRAAFESAGFAAIACPSRTRARKSNADIEIGIDAIDAVRKLKKLDEVIILSGDSDFTPLMTYLRLEGLRTVVFTAPNAVDAYVGSADLAIDRDDLVAAAAAFSKPARTRSRLGWVGVLPRVLFGGRRRARANTFDLDTVADEIAQDLKNRHATVMGRARLRFLLERVEGFTIEDRASKVWLGCTDREGLIHALVERHEQLLVHHDPRGRTSIRLAPGVLKDAAGRRRGRRPGQTAHDVDAAAAILAEHAREIAPRVVGRRAVHRLLASRPGFSTVGASPWLGFGRYGDMLKGLADRRADLQLQVFEDGGAVLTWLPGDPETDAALALALNIVAEAALPMGVDEFAQKIVAAGGPAEWRDHWDSSESFARLLRRLELAGLQISRQPPPGLIRDPAEPSASAGKADADDTE